MHILKYLSLLIAAALLAVSAARADLSIEDLIQTAGLSEGGKAVRDMPKWQGPRKILLREFGIDISEVIAAAPNVEFIEVRTIAEAMQQVDGVDAIIGYCDAELLAAAEDLVWVQIFWAGAERCLSSESIANGDVLLTNMQKISSPAIAEHAVAMIMSLARNLPQFARRMDDSDWARRDEVTARITPIAGKTLLVAGLGGIGTEVARLGAALGMRVIGTRNSSRDGPDFVSYVGLPDELHELASKADFIVNALPLTDATSGIFDAAFFAAARPGAVFISVGRGKSVVTEDLIAALRSGQLSGAGLDVTDPEPLPAASPLWDFENVIITPHIAASGGQPERRRILLMENVRRYLLGEKLFNVVDPVKGY